MKKNNLHNSIIILCITSFFLSFLLVNYYIFFDGNAKSIIVMSKSVNESKNSGNTSNVEEKKDTAANKNSLSYETDFNEASGEKKSTDENKGTNENNATDEKNVAKDNKVTNDNKVIKDDNRVSLLAVGDNLIHIEVYKSGEKKDGTFNYDHLYTNLKSEIKQADIAVINQETIFGDKTIGYSGYPNFCSPKEIGLAIKNAGFDVVLQATNHTLDKGTRGIEYTLSFWKKQKGITLLGINKDKEERDTIRVIEKNGIKFALLNYTEGLNGHTLPSDKLYMVDMMNEKQMKDDIKKAKKLADIVIVFPHWGSEYVYKPNDIQKYYTEFFANEGVDLIIGTHPHVLQPIEWVSGKNGHKTLVYYSLGNYVSYQREAPRMLGGIAEVVFKKDVNGAYIDEAKITPIVTHYENTNGYKIAVYKLSEYSKELANKHGILKLEKNSYFTLDNMKKLAKEILGEWYRE